MLCLVVLTCMCEGKDQQHSSVGMNQGLHKKVSIFDSNAFFKPVQSNICRSASAKSIIINSTFDTCCKNVY